MPYQINDTVVFRRIEKRKNLVPNYLILKSWKDGESDFIRNAIQLHFEQEAHQNFVKWIS